jgi:hypothetical protein
LGRPDRLSVCGLRQPRRKRRRDPLIMTIPRSIAAAASTSSSTAFAPVRGSVPELAGAVVVVVVATVVVVASAVTGTVGGVGLCAESARNTAEPCGRHVKVEVTRIPISIVEMILNDFSLNTTGSVPFFGCHTVFGSCRTAFNGCAFPFTTWIATVLCAV